jgi:putative flippase GtrA
MLLSNLFVKKTDNATIQFFRYIFVGGFAAVANIGTLVFCKEIFGLHYLIANTFGFFTGLITNYTLCKFFVFTENVPIPKAGEFFIHGIISIISLIIDSSLLWIFTQFFGIHYFVSKIMATGIGFIWNFFGRKYFYLRLKKRKI